MTGVAPAQSVRLNRYLSQCGLGSRRGSEELIKEGRVKINGRTCKELATQVEAGDEVVVDGRPVQPAKGVVIAMHKPRGYMSTREDTHGRMTIYDLLPAELQTLHHIGRLDKDSEGLLLLTNRGELSQRLLHPSHGVEKEYEVYVDKPIEGAAIQKLIKGVYTPEGFAKAERVWTTSARKAHVVLKQGLKRQIRHMFFAIGLEVERLVRTRIGGVQLRGMAKGGWKFLSDAEVERYLSPRPPKKPARPKPPAAPADRPRPASKPRRSGGRRPS